MMVAEQSRPSNVVSSRPVGGADLIKQLSLWTKACDSPPSKAANPFAVPVLSSARCAPHHGLIREREKAQVEQHLD